MKIKIVRSKTSGYGYISTLTDSNEFLVCKEISWYENPFKDFLNNHKLSSELIPETESYEQGYSFTELNESEQPINEESKIDAIEFAEWIDDNFKNYGDIGEYSWSKKFPYQNTMMNVTTKELYEEFKSIK